MDVSCQIHALTVLTGEGITRGAYWVGDYVDRGIRWAL